MRNPITGLTVLALALGLAAFRRAERSIVDHL